MIRCYPFSNTFHSSVRILSRGVNERGVDIEKNVDLLQRTPSSWSEEKFGGLQEANLLAYEDNPAGHRWQLLELRNIAAKDNADRPMQRPHLGPAYSCSIPRLQPRMVTIPGHRYSRIAALVFSYHPVADIVPSIPTSKVATGTWPAAAQLTTPVLTSSTYDWYISICSSSHVSRVNFSLRAWII